MLRPSRRGCKCQKLNHRSLLQHKKHHLHMRLRKQNVPRHVMQNQVWLHAAVTQCCMKALHVMECWHVLILPVVIIPVINNLAIQTKLAGYSGCDILEMCIHYLKRYKQGQLSRGGRTHHPDHRSLSTDCRLLCQSCTYLYCDVETFK